MSSDSDDENDQSANSYKMILLKDVSADRMIQKFMQEPTKLRENRLEASDFSIQACFTRLASTGYRAMLINYMNFEVEEVTIKVNHLELEIYHGTRGSSVSFDNLSGVIIGDLSSTFQEYKNLGGDLRKYSIQPTDCLTILSEFRSFDIATIDDQAKYDIYLVCSWKISANADKGSVIPLTHGKMATAKIKMKLQALAKSKFLFLNELFLLSIYKSLVLMGAS